MNTLVASDVTNTFLLQKNPEISLSLSTMSTQSPHMSQILFSTGTCPYLWPGPWIDTLHLFIKILARLASRQR